MKIAFKSDGTNETGRKIIKALEELGGINKTNLKGVNFNEFYYINDGNIIRYSTHLPEGYILKDIDDYLKEKETEHYEFKIAFKANNSNDYYLIIKCLLGLYGNNITELNVSFEQKLYYFYKEGIIDSSTEFPIGYTLLDINDYYSSNIEKSNFTVIHGILIENELIKF